MRYLGILSLLFFCMLQVVQGQEVLDEKVYEENIQSVQLYREGGEISAQLNTPVIPMRSQGLVLEFDDLAYEPDRYSATLIHCNADWTVSGLRSADYLQRYNEFNVNEYEYSVNTRIPYIHFTFRLPAVQRSGNYILKVYRGRNDDEVIFTKRFMVYDEQVKVGMKLMPPNQTGERMTGQQVDIQVNYAGKDLMDPANNVKVVVRQNRRWDNAKVGGRPTFIREGQGILEYRFFDGENIFDAGNEFRFIDLRYVRTTGRNIVSVKMEDDVVYAETAIGKTRADMSYMEYLDLNGQYIIENQERGSPDLESEYILVTFNAEMQDLEGEPYLLGALTNWGNTEAAKMEYHAGKGVYQTSLLLKQGWYDFQLAFKSGSGWNTLPIEGSHYQTENEYDVLVYYRDFGSRYDELLGYVTVNANKKRF